MDEEKFKKKFYKGDLSEYNKADGRTKNLWGVLQNIEKHFKSFSKRCEDAAKRLMTEVIEAKELSFVHSVRYRVKNPNSLLKKYIKKKAKLSKNPPSVYIDSEKYRNCDDANYFKIFYGFGRRQNSYKISV